MFAKETKILVVDDMATMRMLIMQFLSDMGYKDVLEQSDGEKGWTAIRTSVSSVGLVIMDWNMPKLNGLELTKRIRAYPKSWNLPILMITTESESSKVMEAIVSGVDDYIVKPFTIETLKKKLEAIHKKRTR